MVYGFWNNKGGTGKTSLTFQVVTKFAQMNQNNKVLVIDSCPQANLSELLLGGLLGNGSGNLQMLQNTFPIRKTIGGYFQSRFPNPFSPQQLNVSDYICKPFSYNQFIPQNIDLLAGDQIVELQSNAISTLANSIIPGTDAWISIIDWLNDFIKVTNYDYIFIDMNPSFSIYTQISLSIINKLIVPVMADDSSRRALQNVFSLLYGIAMPLNSIYSNFVFSTRLINANRSLPKIHMVIKNRLTQYMGPASAYSSVLSSIDSDLQTVINTTPDIFDSININQLVTEVRDFQTCGVVAFAEGKPFYEINVGRHNIFGNIVQIKSEYLQNCISSIDSIAHKI